MMVVTGSQIFEDTLRRGFGWLCFETLLNSGSKDFDLAAMITRNGVYYATQGLTRLGITKSETLRNFKPETQRIFVYAMTFFAAAALTPYIFKMMGRQIAWQQIAKQAAASTAFWYIINSNNEFTAAKR